MRNTDQQRPRPTAKVIRHARPTVAPPHDTYIVHDPALRASLEEQRAIYRTRIAAIANYLGDGGEDRTEPPA